ncbi:hypothetical protein AWW66_08450 [Micromonospora rosaria]|uniref:Bacterial transcriptional activator domain-containing protein n=1 Tax=Micromonospora rosaria TaxID=47874 RepID=A0A136PVM6_9ACTN|nr:BTAD domain-containing putative transcriptional regulator [Micromonospora rosaria]KXK62462.1 hypothetical protein AWW66_08450 [Micromonospora rosaria]
MRSEHLTFGILGALQVRAAGAPVDVRGAVITRLLGTLLLHANTWVTEGRLTALTWGESNASRNALHCAMARLRRLVSGDDGRDVRIERCGGGYRIVVAPDRVDALRYVALIQQAERAEDGTARFDLLLRALGIWRGPVLTETSEWVRMDSAALALERTRLERTCELADLALRRGAATLALPLVEQLSTYLPFDEPLHARLLRLMAAVGRRAEAIRTYGRIRQRFADELGVDPSDVLHEAYLALLRPGTPARPVQATTSPRRAAPRAAASGTRTRAGVLGSGVGVPLPLDHIADAVLGRPEPPARRRAGVPPPGR